MKKVKLKGFNKSLTPVQRLKKDDTPKENLIQVEPHLNCILQSWEQCAVRFLHASVQMDFVSMFIFMLITNFSKRDPIQNENYVFITIFWENQFSNYVYENTVHMTRTQLAGINLHDARQTITVDTCTQVNWTT